METEINISQRRSVDIGTTQNQPQYVQLSS